MKRILCFLNIFYNGMIMMLLCNDLSWEYAVSIYGTLFSDDCINWLSQSSASYLALSNAIIFY